MRPSLPLRAYADVVLGRQRSPLHDSGPHMVPYLRAANVKDGTLDLSDVKEMNFSPAEQQRFALAPGDVLVTEGSGSLNAVGAASTWTGEISGTVCFQNTLLRLRPTERADSRFLGWWCRHAFASGLFAGIATGANIFHVSAERVRTLPVIDTPLDQQRAIADHLDAETARIDALIAKKQELLLRLVERWEASVSQTIWRSNAPLVKLKYLVGAATSGNRDHASFVVEGTGVPCLRGLNVRASRLDLRDLREISFVDHQSHGASALRAGDVVIVRSGAAGAAAVVPASLQPCNCVDLVIVRRAPNVLPRYLELAINSRNAQEQVSQRSAGAILTHFNAVEASELEIPALEIADQRAAVEKLDGEAARLDHLRASLSGQIGLLRQRRQALITVAVTGERVIGA